jgi:hypothetical protein
MISSFWPALFSVLPIITRIYFDGWLLKFSNLQVTLPENFDGV